MSSLLKSVAREVVLHTPILRETYFDFEFERREKSFRGAYSSFEEAQSHAPRGKLIGYDHKTDLLEQREAFVDELNPADYSVLFWLSQDLPDIRSVFDLGGSLGVAYYAYRTWLNFSPKLRWTVCDIPSTVQLGTELAAKKGATQLHFTTRREEAEGADVYFSAGALQYIDEPFADILGALTKRPRHVIVHRVPMQDGETFYTLQNNGPWVAPYKVVNERELVAQVTALGYEMVNQWPTFRDLQALAHPFDRKAAYKGIYFRRVERV